MHRIKPGFILPSAAFTINRRQVATVARVHQPPAIGDVMYGEVERLGLHTELENKSGRIHRINPGTRAVFVYGHRYAPDFYESTLPDDEVLHVDLVARSGVIGLVTERNSAVTDPTRIRLHGRVHDDAGQPLNTRNHPLIVPKGTTKAKRRARLILVAGTSMNSGKSQAAASICWALTAMGHDVRGSKVTGTASLQDILHMNDAGASVYNDFTHLGWPSTYRLTRDELLEIFNAIDLKFANNAKNYWIVELADGILQPETAELLGAREVQERIHRLVFCGRDAFGCLGGIGILEERFGLTPDAISGIVSGSPLLVREFAEYSDIPVFDSVDVDLQLISRLLL